MDCYTEDEQHGSFLVMLEEHIRCPVRALVVGEDVTVMGFDWDPPGEIVARCRRDRRVHRRRSERHSTAWPACSRRRYSSGCALQRVERRSQASHDLFEPIARILARRASLGR